MTPFQRVLDLAGHEIALAQAQEDYQAALRRGDTRKQREAHQRATQARHAIMRAAHAETRSEG